MQAGNLANDLAVHFLGPGLINIAATQPGFDMIDGNFAIVGRERAAHGGGSIALNDNPIRLYLVHHRAQPGKQGRSQRIKALIGFHDIKVMLGHDPGDIEHLIEHAPVLRGHADYGREARIGLQRGEIGRAHV